MFCFNPLTFTVIAINDRMFLYVHIDIYRYTHDRYHIQRID